MNARQTIDIDDVIEENRKLAIDSKITQSEIKEREKSDCKYAPMEVKSWVIWFVAIVVGGALLIWQRIAGLK